MSDSEQQRAQRSRSATQFLMLYCASVIAFASAFTALISP
jgi:hypothetical protein